MQSRAQNLPPQSVDRAAAIKYYIMTSLRVLSIAVCMITISSFSQIRTSAQTQTQQLNQQNVDITVQKMTLDAQKERITKLEEEILDHDRTINRAIGLGMAFSGLLMILQTVQIIVSFKRIRK